MFCGLGSCSSVLAVQIHTNTNSETAVGPVMRGEHNNLSVQVEENASTGYWLFIHPSAINQWVNRWMKSMKSYKKKKETGAEPERQHVGRVHQLLPSPRSVDCSGIVRQGNKWFSVTEPFSHGDHQQLALSFTSHCPFPVAVTHSHMISGNMSAALVSLQVLKIKFVLCQRLLPGYGGVWGSGIRENN